MNKARIKFLGLFICALCKVQTVSFQKLAGAFESAAQSDSSLRRIQRFMAACNFTGDIIAHLIFSLLPHRDKYRPAMDRTNRKFGETNINVLTPAVIHDGVAFPLLITMLNKRGNSHTDWRIEIMNQGKTVFAQIMSLIPKYGFDKCVKRNNGNRHAIGFKCRDQFMVMNFVQFTDQDSV
jgi:hypothetical protein